jgi:hypothetical protein
MNSCPRDTARALTQDEHEKWNPHNYPGTKQICCMCESPTGRCEDDSLYIEYHSGPYCEECFNSLAP